MAEVRFTGIVNGVNPHTGQGKPPELKYTASGTPQLVFTVAEGHGKKQADGTWKNEASTFWNCTAWGQLADTWGQVQPGALVEIIGRTETRTYTRQDGSTGYHFGVTVDFMRHSPRAKNQPQQQGQAEQSYQNGYAARAGIPQQGYGAPPQGNQPPQADPWANQPAAQGWGTTQPPADEPAPF